MQYCLPLCAAAAHILKCRSVCIYHGASGMPPPAQVGRSIPTERRADVGIGPYGGWKEYLG